MQDLITFKAYSALIESHDFSNLTPYHSYSTDDGHNVDVHIFRNGEHKTAIFHNKSLGAITKIVAFPHSSNLSKEELMHAGKEVQQNDLKESVELIQEKMQTLSTGEPAPKLDNDPAGKIAEINLYKELVNHRHKQDGTFGSREHKFELKQHDEELTKITKDQDPKQVAVRAAHGKAMAAAVIKHVEEHHPGATLSRIGRTSKPGDIARFTKGVHTDGQENPSDVTLELKHSDGEHSFLGVSAKSTGKSSGNITAKNPGVAGQDEFLSGGPATRKSEANKIAKAGREKILKKWKMEDLPDRSKTGDSRKARVTDTDPKTGKPVINELGKKMNVDFKQNNEETARELQIQLEHLMSKGTKGHQHIGKWLHNNLVSDEGMPWIKATGHGKELDKVHAVVKHGSESPLSDILKNKNTKFAIHRSGSAVTLHKVEKDGTHTQIVRVATKPNSHGAYSSQMYNFTPSSNF
jgi:hypothetical protein